MRNFLAGAATMYFVSGVIVTTSLLVHTNGPVPWWLPPFWTVTWLWQVIEAIFA